MKAIKRNKRNNNKKNIYADIDWEKAKVFFQRPFENRENKSGSLQVRDILKVLAAAAGIGMIFIFPGAAPVLGSLILGKKSYNRWQVKRMLSRLENQKYIGVEYLPDGRVKVKITRNGLEKALTYELESMQIKRPKRWDGKWRVVTFDIPNKYKRVRDIFRMRLRQLGLYQFQESVYASPYPCFNEIEFLREIYGVAVTVRYLLVEKIEDDSFLRSYFELQ
ncbi:hypothetical protein HZB96_02330 [Candidatus Gottesmanbacteria bacterium]|nr:hypothetical protein [Candidatus Gottesmanbacteria bacterium]